MPVMRRGKSATTGIDVSNDIPDVGTFDASGALDMLPMLVSIYKNSVAREQGTKEFLESVAHFSQKYKVPNLMEAAQWLAEKFPRVSAHMRMNPNLQPNTYSAAMRIPPGQVKAPLPMEVSSIGLKDMRGNAPEVADMTRGILAHEATHTAQALGNSEFLPMYRSANDLVGYAKNPFELKAYAEQAQHGWSPIRPNVDKQTAIQLLEAIAVRGGQDGRAAALRNLLRQRLGREPMAVSHATKIP